MTVVPLTRIILVIICYTVIKVITLDTGKDYKMELHGFDFLRYKVFAQDL